MREWKQLRKADADAPQKILQYAQRTRENHENMEVKHEKDMAEQLDGYKRYTENVDIVMARLEGELAQLVEEKMASVVSKVTKELENDPKYRAKQRARGLDDLESMLNDPKEVEKLEAMHSTVKLMAEAQGRIDADAAMAGQQSNRDASSIGGAADKKT